MKFLGRMVSYAVPSGVKVLVANGDLDQARAIAEQFVKEGNAVTPKETEEVAISFRKGHFVLS